MFFWKKLRFCAIWHSWIKKLCGYFFLLNKCQYATFQENATLVDWNETNLLEAEKFAQNLEQSHLALKRINNCNGGPRLKKIQARSFTPCPAKGKICKKFMQTVWPILHLYVVTANTVIEDMVEATHKGFNTTMVEANLECQLKIQLYNLFCFWFFWLLFYFLLILQKTRIIAHTRV